MAEMSHSLEGMSLHDARVSHHGGGPGWAEEFARLMPMAPGQAHDAHFEHLYQQAQQHQQQQQPGGWATEFMGSQDPGQQLSHDDFERIYNQGSNSSWAEEFETSTQTRADEWAQEFTQLQAQDEKLGVSLAAGKILETVTDPMIQQTQFMAFMRQLRDGEVEIEDKKVVVVKDPSSWATEYERQPEHLEGAWTKAEGELRPLDWAREFAQSAEAKRMRWVDSEGEDTTWEKEYMLSDRDKGKGKMTEEFLGEAETEAFRQGLPRAYETESKNSLEDWVDMYKKSIEPLRDEEAENWEAMQKDWNRYKFEGYGYEGYNKELYATYIYEENNPFLGTAHPVEEAKEALRASRLGAAILLLEAAVKRDPANGEAWEMLGLAQAENEKDQLAIAALQNAVRIDGSRLPSWMALSASYSNEMCRPEAFNALQSWIANNPKYAHILKTAKLGTGDRHREVVGLFIEAACSLEGGRVDPDVQLALGVLFCTTSEYDKAIDCFTAAVHERPDDFVLWNRLGATLANSGRSEQAIEAYHRALELNPGFVRARYNLGISCISLDAYKEASEHFLTALSQQAQAGGQAPTQTSKTIWDTLRMTFSMMARTDLAEKCNLLDVNAFRQEFEF